MVEKKVGKFDDPKSEVGKVELTVVKKVEKWVQMSVVKKVELTELQMVFGKVDKKVY